MEKFRGEICCWRERSRGCLYSGWGLYVVGWGFGGGWEIIVLAVGLRIDGFDGRI